MNRIIGALLLLPAAVHVSSASAQDLDDAAIAHIAVTANQLDITGAEQVLEKSSNTQVRAFAQTMIRDHTRVIEQAAALVERLGVTPKDNETSRALVTQAAQVRHRLDELHGSALDRAYMEHEVAYHGAVIAALEDTLIPNTSNGELEQLLQDVLPALRAHLEHAQRVSAELRAG